MLSRVPPILGYQSRYQPVVGYRTRKQVFGDVEAVQEKSFAEVVASREAG